MCVVRHRSVRHCKREWRMMDRKVGMVGTEIGCSKEGGKAARSV